jgi:hypothetical protein
MPRTCGFSWFVEYEPTATPELVISDEGVIFGDEDDDEEENLEDMQDELDNMMDKEGMMVAIRGMMDEMHMTGVLMDKDHEDDHGVLHICGFMQSP